MIGNADGGGIVAKEAGFVTDLRLVVLATAMVLLVPLLAMRFTQQVAWTVFDFGAAAVLLMAAGVGCLRAARRVQGARRRMAVVAVLALAFVAVWAELAVGVLFGFGS